MRSGFDSKIVLIFSIFSRFRRNRAVSKLETLSKCRKDRQIGERVGSGAGVATARLTQSNRLLEYREANPPPGKRFYRASFSP